MIASLTLILFLAGLVFCLAAGLPLLCALLFGLACFIAYARYRNISFREILRLLLIGVGKSSNILKIFVLIGFLTALWRACGTIPFIVYYGLQLIRPRIFILSVFLLCSLVSFLMGTSFGTASTAGVICMILARINQIHPVIAAGAVLSGCFFGDRCSPMSSSASLVADLTGTNLYDNIKAMFRTSAIPFILTCLLYLLAGGQAQEQAGAASIMEEFPRLFNLNWYVVIPAAIILILCLFRLDVKLIMAVSAAISFLLCLTAQGLPADRVLRFLFSGYLPEAESPLSPLLAGGGLFSMVNVGLIVCISSSYLGLLERTGLLDSLQDAVRTFSSRFGIFPASCIAGLASSAFSCNQTLASMLTCELCRKNYTDSGRLALDLEDSVILLAALIPWNIAGSAPLATVEAGTESLVFAFYLFLVPLCRILGGMRKKSLCFHPCKKRPRGGQR